MVLNLEKENSLKLEIKMKNGEDYEVVPNIPISSKKEALKWFVKTFVGNSTMILLERKGDLRAVPVGEIKDVEAIEK